MRIYSLGSDDVIVYNNELYAKLKARVNTDEQIQEAEEMLDRSITKIKRSGPRKASKASADTDYDAIKSDLRAGIKPGLIVVKHNVPYWKVMYARKQITDAGEIIPKVKKEMQDPTDPDLKTYQCVGNHRFTSTEEKSKARCHCGANAFREIKQ